MRASTISIRVLTSNVKSYYASVEFFICLNFDSIVSPSLPRRSILIVFRWNSIFYDTLVLKSEISLSMYSSNWCYFKNSRRENNLEILGELCEFWLMSPVCLIWSINTVASFSISFLQVSIISVSVKSRVWLRGR